MMLNNNWRYFNIIVKNKIKLKILSITIFKQEEKNNKNAVKHQINIFKKIKKIHSKEKENNQRI